MPGITIYYGDAGSGKTSAIIRQFNKENLEIIVSELMEAQLYVR